MSVLTAKRSEVLCEEIKKIVKTQHNIDVRVEYTHSSWTNTASVVVRATININED